jgi:hypothetical protein
MKYSPKPLKMSHSTGRLPSVSAERPKKVPGSGEVLYRHFLPVIPSLCKCRDNLMKRPLVLCDTGLGQHWLPTEGGGL